MHSMSSGKIFRSGRGRAISMLGLQCRYLQLRRGRDLFSMHFGQIQHHERAVVHGLRRRDLQPHRGRKLFSMHAWHIQPHERIVVHELLPGLLLHFQGEHELYSM